MSLGNGHKCFGTITVERIHGIKQTKICFKEEIPAKIHTHVEEALCPVNFNGYR
jgi:hypothetical protein